MYQILGVKKLDYVSKKTNQPVKGYNLFVGYKQDNVDGMATDVLYVGDTVDGVENIKVNTACDVMFNKYGRVQAIVRK